MERENNLPFLSSATFSLSLQTAISYVANLAATRENWFWGFPARSETNRPVHTQKKKRYRFEVLVISRRGIVLFMLRQQRC